MVRASALQSGGQGSNHTNGNVYLLAATLVIIDNK